MIAEIEERIAEWTHLPPDHGEPMQVGMRVCVLRAGQRWFGKAVHDVCMLQCYSAVWWFQVRWFQSCAVFFSVINE